jgi:hypothetical protein
MTIQRYTIPEFAHKHPDKDGEWLHDPDREIERKLNKAEVLAERLEIISRLKNQAEKLLTESYEKNEAQAKEI